MSDLDPKMTAIGPSLEPAPPIGPGDPRANPPPTSTAVAQQGKFDNAVDFAAGWLKSHKISAHTITLAVTAIATVWASDPAFRQAVQHYWAMVPPQVHAILVGVGAIISFYWKSQKKEN